MGITISPTSAEIALGAILQLSSSAPAKWESACRDIATVTQEGLVTATSGTYSGPYYTNGGQVRIQCTELNAAGAPVGAPATCNVTVLGTGLRPFLTAVNETPQWQNRLGT